MSEYKLKVKYILRWLNRHLRYPSNGSVGDRWYRPSVKLLLYYGLVVVGVSLLSIIDIPITDKTILTIGIILIAVRVTHKLFFGMALVLMAYMPVLFAIDQSELAMNLSTYVFYLLCLGTVCSVILLRRQND